MVDKETELFQKFIVKQSILVADESASSRSGVFRVLSELGAKPTQVGLASTLSSAIEEINRRRPSIILAEYNFGKSCGLELTPHLKALDPPIKNALFFLLTSNTSQTAVARAAEEDVDAFILKPFTPEIVRKAIIKTALMKIHPPEYVKVIEGGKVKLAAADLDGAEAEFNRACKLDPKPALALYYLGQTHFMRKIINEAQGDYEQGLNCNRIHYKCLIGLYELLMDLKAHGKAYEVVKKISQYFPANPKRLTEVLRLAIINKQYDDVEKYYSIFCNIEGRSDVLVNYICAALVVCGKYYLMSGNRTRALELMQKAAATSAGKTKILREIVQTLMDGRLTQEAGKFLERFPMDTRQTAEYQLLEFQVYASGASAGPVVTRGRDLIQKGFVDERFYETMILKSIEAGAAASAENLVSEASGKYPERAGVFAKLIEGMLKENAANAKKSEPA